MAETTTPAPTADDSSWSNSLDALLKAGTTIYTGVTNAQTAKANAGAASKTNAAIAANSQSNVMKYGIIAGAVVAVIIVVVLVMRRGK